MKFEAEVISDEVLPAIRSIMATRLSRDYGYTQEEIAVKLSVTQPAVSQYINETRADSNVIKKLREDPQIDILLDDAVSESAENKDFAATLGQAVKTIRDKGILKERFEDTKRL